jgi:hypothetical protein
MGGAGIRMMPSRKIPAQTTQTPSMPANIQMIGEIFLLGLAGDSAFRAGLTGCAGSGCFKLVPHSMQCCALGLFLCPHLGQTTKLVDNSDFPHFSQNFAPFALLVPQSGHFISHLHYSHGMKSKY